MTVKAIENMIKMSKRLVSGDKEGFNSDLKVLHEVRSSRPSRILAALEKSIAEEDKVTSSKDKQISSHEEGQESQTQEHPMG